MLSFSVVKNLDVFKGLSLDLGVSCIANAMHPAPAGVIAEKLKTFQCASRAGSDQNFREMKYHAGVVPPRKVKA